MKPVDTKAPNRNNAASPEVTDANDSAAESSSEANPFQAGLGLRGRRAMAGSEAYAEFQ